jgi:hypothetical protein
MNNSKINTILANVPFSYQNMKPVAYEIQAVAEADELDEREAEFAFKDWVYANKDAFLGDTMMIQAANDVWFDALYKTSQPPKFTQTRKCRVCGCRKGVIEQYASGRKYIETLICGHRSE